MPLNLPSDDIAYLVCLFANPGAAHGNNVPYEKTPIARQMLERWASGGEGDFNRGVLEEFQRRYPGKFEHVHGEDVKVKLEDAANNLDWAWSD